MIKTIFALMLIAGIVWAAHAGPAFARYRARALLDWRRA